MAELTGPVQLFEANTDAVDSTPKHQLGARAFDRDGGEYVYLEGVASVAANLAVTYNDQFEVALLAASAVGSVAIAMAAIVANKYGWFQIFGAGSAVANAAIAKDKPLYITASGGKIDDAAVAGDWINGLVSSTAAAAQDDVIDVQLNYPSVCDGGYLV